MVLDSPIILLCLLLLFVNFNRITSLFQSLFCVQFSLILFMSRVWDSYLNESDQEDDDTFTPSKTNVVFLVDASTSMNVDIKGNQSPFQATLKCISDFLIQKLNQNDGDKLSIVFYGTISSKSARNSPSIYVLQRMESPSIDIILELQSLVNDTKYFEKQIGTATTRSLMDAFFECQHIFNEKNQNNVKKYVYLITNDDKPYSETDSISAKLYQKSQDMASSNIALEIFGMGSTSKPFVYESFYQSLHYYTYADDTPSSFTPISPVDSYRDLGNLLKVKESAQRVQFRVPLILSKSLTIGVKGYNKFSERKKPRSVLLDPKMNQEVGSERLALCSTTGKEVTIQEMQYAYPVGGQMSIFTESEYKNIKSFGDQGILLLGFRSAESLKVKFNIKPAKFIIPDEDTYIGSCSLMAHFVERMASRNLIAICRFISRKNGSPKLVALKPQIASYNAIDRREIPCGFFMIILPFADDLRSITAKAPELPDQEEVDMLKSIITAIGVTSFCPESHRNPVLQKHYETLHSLAFESANVPLEKVIKHQPEPAPEQSCIEMIKNFNEMTALKHGNSNHLKRDNAAGATESRKRQKKDEEFGIEDFRTAMKEGTLTKFTVAQISQCLQSLNVKAKGRKKADLIEQLIANL
ncbi:SPOC like C-terminal domain-containing protein [Globomyces pollinis-pini]|nr:SPOC like C-terminal domain-containing protein [Globomyces pollinis-pini]